MLDIGEWWLIKPVADALLATQGRDFAIDIGANRGEWTRWMVTMFDEVLAIEPDPRAHDFIGAAENLAIHEAVVSDKVGFMLMHFRDSPDQNSILEHHPIGGNSGSPVPPIKSSLVDSVTLDYEAPYGADFVKMDIEGAEDMVMRSCVGDQWERTVFVIECHDTFDGVNHHLIRLGKNVTRISHPISGTHPGHCWAIGTPK